MKKTIISFRHIMLQPIFKSATNCPSTTFYHSKRGSKGTNKKEVRYVYTLWNKHLS